MQEKYPREVDDGTLTTKEKSQGWKRVKVGPSAVISVKPVDEEILQRMPKIDSRRLSRGTPRPIKLLVNLRAFVNSLVKD